MARIFLIGASGYVGGDALYVVADANPQYEITCLVEGSDIGALIASQYARVKLVYGALDDTELIEKESRKADIVCYFTGTGNGSSIRAATRGLMSPGPASDKFLICITESWYSLVSKGSGSPVSVYDDFDNFQPILDSQDDVLDHVLGDSATGVRAQYGGKLQSALVVPSCIYGSGRGPSGRRSLHASELCKVTLEQDHGIRVGSDEFVGSFVHISDLSDLLLKLVDEAAAGGSKAEWPGKPAVWGKEGVYFAESSECRWADVAGWIATEAHKKGFIKSPRVKDISPEVAQKLSPAADSWAASVHVKARRGREVLKWQPRGPALKDEVSSMVDYEARARQLVVGHAQKASGDA